MTQLRSQITDQEYVTQTEREEKKWKMLYC